MLFALPRGLVILILLCYLIWLAFLTKKIVALSHQGRINRPQVLFSLLFVWLLPIAGPVGIHFFLKRPQGN